MSGEPPYSPADIKELVVGYAELVEKMTIAEQGLDARAIEALKYSLLSSALDTAEEEGGREIRIRYHNTEHEKLVFYIEGLKEKEIGVSSIPLETYKKIETNLEEILQSLVGGSIRTHGDASMRTGDKDVEIAVTDRGSQLIQISPR